MIDFVRIGLAVGAAVFLAWISDAPSWVVPIYVTIFLK